jgi:hypothetical protein
MDHVPFTIFTLGPSPQPVLRAGYCPADLVAKQAQAGEGVIEGVLGDYITDQVILPTNGAPYLRRRSAVSIAERTAMLRFTPSPDRLTLLLDVLKAKGMTITEEDLTAARDRLRK